MNGVEVVILLLRIYSFLILGRVLLSWVPLFTQRPLDLRNPFVRFLVDVTEPVLAPVRRYTMIGMIDLSPIAVIILLTVIGQVLERKVA